MAPYLWERAIRTVDVIALSHAHDDHIGGLPALVSDFQPRELWTGATPDSPRGTTLRDKAAENQTQDRAALKRPRVLPSAARKSRCWRRCPITSPTTRPRTTIRWCCACATGSTRSCCTGDVERPIERGMLDANEIQPTDVLKVAHHGSRTSSTEEFLGAVSPRSP